MRTIALLSAISLLLGGPAAAQQSHHEPGTGLAAFRAAAYAADPRILYVDALDHAFRAADTVEAGYVTVRLANRGSEPHQVALVRLGQGRTIADLLAAVAKGGAMPAWATEVGGPNAAAAGGTSGTALELDPGHYALVCLLRGPDRAVHALQGLARNLVVVPPRTRSVAARPVVPDAEVTMSDRGFQFERPLAAGRQLLRVTNAASRAHEILFMRLEPGQTARDVAEYLRDGKGAPPGRPVGGATGIATGGWNDVSLDLVPGEYAIVSLYPDPKGGKSHREPGMLAQITVK